MIVSATLFVLTCAIPTSVKVRVGNYLVTAPNGISVIDGNASAIVIDFGGDYVAGLAAPDNSYHAQTLSLKGATVLLEWGRAGNGAVGRLTSDRPITADVHLLSGTWPGFKTTYTAVDSHVVAGTPFQSQAAFIDFEPPVGLHQGVVNLKLESGQRCHFAIATKKTSLRSSRIDAQLDKARTAYLKRRPTATGEWGDFVGAIADNMNNSRIYASDEKAVAYSVSRGWAGGNPNNAPFFCWDSFFNGALGCLDDPETARNTVRAILGWQTPDGMVPNFGHWQFDKSRASNDRSQPPVGSMCVWKMHMRWPNLAFLKEVYPKLLKWHRWWPKNRDGNHDGLLEWGSSAAGKQGALWETG
ncbi:MAG: MGH1-like glycoside hydrolase domain-containing protein, partial [Fimbriimonadaceae bacterium]